MKEIFKSFAPLLAALALMVSVALGVKWVHQEGYNAGFRTAQAEGVAELEKLRTSNAKERQKIAAEALQKANADALKLLAETKRADDLVNQLATTKQEFRRNTDKLTGEIQRVTTLYRRTLDAPPEPLPAAVFTTGFVRVWNEALDPAAMAMRASQSASGTVALTRNTGAADDLDSGITPAVLLTNQVRNSEKYASCRAQLTSLIEYYTHGR